jgi:hypothetical protein
LSCSVTIRCLFDEVKSMSHLASLDPLSNSAPLGDQEIQQAAQQRLHESPYAAVRALDCASQAGVLTVAGRVPSYYIRQVAFESLRNLRGVCRLVDCMEVDGSYAAGNY